MRTIPVYGVGVVGDVPGEGVGIPDRDLREILGVEEAYDPHLHPRDRMGKWIRSLGLPKVYEVGGAVRDELLGKDPKDIDYMALASPEEIKAAVEAHGGRADPLTVRDRMVGVRAHMPGVTPPEGVEIAPPRIEMSTGPGRQDFSIEPHPDIGGALIEDLLDSDSFRRDFTVNALYRDEHDNVIDPTGHGIADVANGTLRTTHHDSFRDDPLRILRGARFAAQHSLVPEPETFAQMRAHADAVTALTQKGVSGTVVSEMNKLLMSRRPSDGLRLLRDTGALAHLFPEIAPIIGYDQQSAYHDLTLDEHTFRVVDEVAKQGGSLEARWAALLHDTGKPDVEFERKGRKHFYAAPENDYIAHEDAGVVRARALLNRIGNVPDDSKRRILKIISEHMLREADKPTAVKARRLRRRLTDDEIRDVLIHRRADMRSKGEDDDPIPTPLIDKLEELVAAEKDAPRSLADLKIRGQDIVALGASGPQIGEILDTLLTEVVNQPNVNNHEWLIAHAAKLLRQSRG